MGGLGRIDETRKKISEKSLKIIRGIWGRHNYHQTLDYLRKILSTVSEKDSDDAPGSRSLRFIWSCVNMAERIHFHAQFRMPCHQFMAK